MNSESNPVVEVEDKPKKKGGLDIFGYRFPWWVVIVFILSLFVFAYYSRINGYLACVMKGDNMQKGGAIRELPSQGPIQILEAESAPMEVKRLFRNAGMF